MIQLLNILAETTTKEPQGLDRIFGNPYMFPALLIVMFYFVLFRPQMRQRKEQAARIASLKAGDKVITAAGLHGIIHSVKDTTVVIKVAEGTNLEFEKVAVLSVAKKD